MKDIKISGKTHICGIIGDPIEHTLSPAMHNSMYKMDILADKIGAVNTIINDNGILTGYNTDAQGFLKALVEKDIRPAGKNVLLLGAGGAARAIGFILSEERAHLTILNRKEELSWAKDLAKCLSQTYSAKVKAGELSKKNLGKLIPTTDILVN